MSGYRQTVGGYTILELMIVVTVSTLLFAAAISAYTIQNRRGEFSSSVNDFAQNIQDVLNDVETGFYPSNASFSCTANASGGQPNIDYSTSAQQGTNSGCTFVGKAIQFAPHNRPSAFDVYTVVGRSKVAGSEDPVVNIAQARPVALRTLVDSKSLIGNVEVTSVRSGGADLAGFSIISNSNTGTISTGLNSRTSLAVIPGSMGELGNPTFITQVSGIGPSSITANTVDVCIKEHGSNGRTALIQLASGESQIIVKTRVDQPCT